MNTPSPESPVPSPGPIAFIGGGNMARSLIGGLIARGTVPGSIRVADPQAASREALAADFGVAAFDDNARAVEDAAVWLLAVKPQVMRAVCEALSGIAQASRPLVVSIAAGITATQLSRWLGGDVAVVRCMPNTPAAIGKGMLVVCANDRTTRAELRYVEEILSASGAVATVDDERLMDAVTAVSGSGPAYVFHFIECLTAAAEQAGLPAATARLLAMQTVFGAASLAAESGEDPGELRRQVTSPNGTTAAALKVMMEGDALKVLLAAAVDAARLRSVELGK